MRHRKQKTACRRRGMFIIKGNPHLRMGVRICEDGDSVVCVCRGVPAFFVSLLHLLLPAGAGCEHFSRPEVALRAQQGVVFFPLPAGAGFMGSRVPRILWTLQGMPRGDGFEGGLRLLWHCVPSAGADDVLYMHRMFWAQERVFRRAHWFSPSVRVGA